MSTANAYLVLWIDSEANPPTIVSAGVYSEETPSSIRPFIPVAIYSISTTLWGFGFAAEQIRNMIKTNLHYAWLRPLMDKPIPRRA